MRLVSNKICEWKRLGDTQYELRTGLPYFTERNGPNLYVKLARYVCSRYAGCEHFMSKLGPSAPRVGESYLGF